MNPPSPSPTASAPPWWERRPGIVAAGVLTVAALGAYGTSFRVPFVFDDMPSIFHHADDRHLGLLGDVLSTARDRLTVSGRPVLQATLAVNRALGGATVWGYHAVNLAIHVLAGLALFGLVRRTLRLRSGQALSHQTGRDPDTVESGLRSDATLVALAAALLWTVHPLQAEAVTYVIQRAESLMGLFFLLTLYCFARALDAPRPRPWYVLTVAACLLGMGTKEVMALAPVMVLLYDRTFATGSLREAWRRRRGFYGCLAATWVPLALLVAATGGNRGGSFAFTPDLAITYWLTQCEAIPRYLALAAWPHPLVFEYGVLARPDLAEALPGALLVAGLVAAVLLEWWRHPAVGFLGAWFLGILAPTSLMPGRTEMIVEHRMYLPLAAVVTLAVAVVGHWTGRRGLVACLALALAAVSLTAARNLDYRSRLTLWGDTVRKRPENSLARLNYGAALCDSGRFAEALAQFEIARRIGPDDAETEVDLAAALTGLDRPEDALVHFERAVQLMPDDARVEYNLGSHLYRMGRGPEAIAHLERAVRLAPGQPSMLVNLAAALLQAGRGPEAVARCEEALRVAPDRADLHYNLAAALLATGRVDAAIGEFRAVIRLAPAEGAPHLALAEALARAGRDTEAAAERAAGRRLESAAAPNPPPTGR
ncbi:MAG TPA: tetratricopeptide repeat protein [Opitutaceae bacterium]|nr:tetratricopeptide repeat protein [Opitutaceae bacterium]